MRKQTFIAVVAAVSLVGVSATALAEDGRDRDRDVGWKIEKKHDRDRDGRDHRKGDRRPAKVVKQDRKKRRSGHGQVDDRDRIGRHHRDRDHDRDRDRHRRPRDRDRVIIIRDHDRYDDWDYIGPNNWDRWGNRARVISVVPIHKIIRQGRHCRRDYGAGDWLEFNLGDILISAGKSGDDCRYIDREVRKHYRVTYRYKGRLHTVRMYRHPGRYVRVNRFGDLIRGRR